MQWIMRKPLYPSTPTDERGLEYFYVERRTLADYRRGPLGRYFDGFAAGLKKNGYVPHTACTILGTCCVFNAFLIERGIKAASAITEELIPPFLEVYLRDVRTSSARYSPRHHCLSNLKHLFLYLEAIKVYVPPKPEPVVTRYSWILDPYIEYLRDEQAIAPVTLKRHVAHITAFLESLKEDVQRSRLKAARASTLR